MQTFSSKSVILLASIGLACSSSNGSSPPPGGNSGGASMGGSASGGSAAGGKLATGGSGAGGASVGSGGQGSGGSSSASGGKSASGGSSAGAGSVGTSGGAGGGATSPGSGGASSSGGSGGSSSGSSASAGGDGGMTTPDIDGGSGTAVPSAGCGKTSTVTFTTVPKEDANAQPGTPAANNSGGQGTGQGGYVSITSAGQQRGFAMRLPDNYDNTKPYWLIFAFHWNGGASVDVDTGGANGYFEAYYGLQKESKNGAIFVGPDSIGSGWPNTNGEDLTFTDDMVKLISDNYCVDMSNIITSGFSYGGGMSYELACARGNAKTNTAGYAFRAAIIFEGGLLSGCDGG
ncbi:MAG: hypothetical protein ABSB49_20435, partial [Polyangia bacterium]